ncbi:ABC transporter ATP-binding protein [Paenirhodobacter populi]|uniref:ABC transporter ATP-binding protein n=1 Tax=Paenirhodobacter populi TaxID=2306993 RepID=A0A443JRA5_9RHOB|nr:ABC transporter ATP-binding protein [Sinirhodobacter populi]RWR05770.1 ABC transporter ATP-binding protein [Sinirhodobacter populi]RWR23019.1 ABC transporter ATP-binding protein [Sinirhodobacter populi]
MIAFEALTKSYDGRNVVDNVTASFATGTITAVVGTSGSGKTTLLRMINRLIEPTTGCVQINGRDVSELPEVALRRSIGYVIQGYGLFPHWTAARNIGVVPRLLGWRTSEIEARTAELLRLLQLDPAQIGPRYPHQLSGGQAQRIGVARALAARPDVLLMDEPFGALDPVIRRQAQRDLSEIQHQLGTTIILVTHDMNEALRLGNAIAVMRDGRFEQFAPPSEIVCAPATPFVAELVGEEGRALRLLSLTPVGPHLRTGEAPGDPVADTASLSDALSEMIWTGRDRLPVADRSGRRLGVIERADILSAGRRAAPV